MEWQPISTCPNQTTVLVCNDCFLGWHVVAIQNALEGRRAVLCACYVGLLASDVRSAAQGRSGYVARVLGVV